MADEYLPPIVARLVADTSEFARKLDQARKDLDKTGDSAERDGKRVSDSLDQSGESADRNRKKWLAFGAASAGAFALWRRHSSAMAQTAGAAGGGGSGRGIGSRTFAAAAPGMLGLSGKAAGMIGGGATGLAALPGIAAVAHGLLGVGAAAGAASIGIGVLGAGFKLADQKGSAFQKNFKALEKTWKSVGQQAIQPMLGPLNTALKEIGPILKGLLPELQQVFGQAGRLIQPLLKGFAQMAHTLLPIIAKLIGNVVPLIQPMIGMITKLLAGLLTAMDSLLKAAGPGLKMLSSIIGGVAKTLGQVFRAMAPAFGAGLKVLAALGGVMAAVLPAVAKLAAILAKALAPILTYIAKALQQLLPALAPVFKIFAQLAGAILGDVLSMLRPFVTLIKDLAPSFVILGRVAGQFFNTLENTGVFQVLADALENIAPLLAHLINAFVARLAPILPTLIGLLGKLVSDGIQLMSAGLQALLPAFFQLLDAILVPLLPIIQQLAPVIAQLAQIITTLLVQGLKLLMPIIKPLLPLIIALVVPFGELFAVLRGGSMVAGIFRASIALVVGVLAGLLASAKNLIGDLVDVLKGAWNLISEGIHAVWGILPGFFKHTLGDIFTYVTTPVRIIGDVLSGNWSKIGKDITRAWDAIKDFFERTWGKILGGAFKFIGNLVSTIFNAGKKAFLAALHFGEQIVGGLLNALEFLPNLVAKLLKKIPIIGGALSGVVHATLGGGILHSIGSVLGLAEGGIAVKPTLAMIGEGGEPEAVLPLSQLRQLLSGRQGDFYPAAPSAAQTGGPGGLHIGTVAVYGNNMNERQMMQELYLKLRPLLTSPAA